MTTGIGKIVADISDIYEKENGSIKITYINKNISEFRKIARLIKTSMGNFATGYPFYINFTQMEELPIIEEQLRYNHELRLAQANVSTQIWPCEICLRRNGEIMPDLKQICKPCTKICDELKPRKVINRLPDMDMWLICKDGTLNETSKILGEELIKNGFNTSDVDPVKTIHDINEITNELKSGIVPGKLLPIDAHIIEYGSLMKNIQSLPDEIASGVNYEYIPYIPIHPLSLRKKWQYDDMAYNFVHDFLSSFTEDHVGFDQNLLNILESVRKNLKSTYTQEELYDILLKTGCESTIRRHQNPILKKSFEERIKSW